MGRPHFSNAAYLMSLDNLLHRRDPSPWEQFFASPLLFLARHSYNTQSTYRPRPSNADTVRIVCISDTHNIHGSLPPLPAGDLLVHAGDLSQSGSIEEMNAALDWMTVQPHLHKIFIAGNHDRCLEDPSYQSTIKTLYPNLVYLQNASISLDINGRIIKLYGSPLTPRHGSWAFQYPRIPASQVFSSTTWSSVPMDTDVLITHGPPAHHLDHGSGCNALLDLLWKLRPKLHIFGHIHAARGVQAVTWTLGQSAYEKVSSRQGGWMDLVPIWLQSIRWLWQSGPRLREAATVLVNASAVGGVRDEKRYSAIVVDI